MKKCCIIILFLTIALLSCEKRKETFPRIVIANVELEKQIKDYQKYIRFEQPVPKDLDVTFHVMYSQVKDSFDRYVLYVEADPTTVKERPFHFVSRVKNKDVFFHSVGSRTQTDQVPNHFRLSERAYESFVRKYYPHGEYAYIKAKRTYAPKAFIIVFLNGKLIHKTIRQANFEDPVHVSVNGTVFFI